MENENHMVRIENIPATFVGKAVLGKTMLLGTRFDDMSKNSLLVNHLFPNRRSCIYIQDIYKQYIFHFASPVEI